MTEFYKIKSEIITLLHTFGEDPNTFHIKPVDNLHTPVHTEANAFLVSKVNWDCFEKNYRLGSFKSILYLRPLFALAGIKTFTHPVLDRISNLPRDIFTYEEELKFRNFYISRFWLKVNVKENK